MVDLYLMSQTDRGLWLKKSLEGSLPGLQVSGAVLEGRASPEGVRFRQDMAAFRGSASGTTRGETYRSTLDYDGVLRGHTGQRQGGWSGAEALGAEALRADKGDRGRE